MLFFISYPEITEKLAIPFKYISCYSLSVKAHIGQFVAANLNTSHVILYQYLQHMQKGYELDLNTSHVILYRIPVSRSIDLKGFKYISCYSLSLS